MRRLVPVMFLSVAIAACGGHSTPTAPSTSNTTSAQPGTPAPSTGTGATINGTLQAQSAAAAIGYAPRGTTLSGVTVIVVGTSISTTADANGRFTLTNVPPGDVQLKITSSTTDVTVSVGPVQASETVTIQIVVNGNSATVTSGTPPTSTNPTPNPAPTPPPSTSPEPPDPKEPPDAQDQSASIEGTLKKMSGTKPALTLTVDTTTVKTTSSTEVKRRGDVQTLADLQVGQTLHVVGTRQTDGSIVAREIDIDNDAEGGEFEIEGALGGLSGTCPSVKFVVNGFTIATSKSTTFDGGACTALKSGDKVDVKGTKQSDGTVAATTVKKED